MATGATLTALTQRFRPEPCPNSAHFAFVLALPAGESIWSGLVNRLSQPLTNMPFPWETVPPLAIICGATALMGALPHGIQKLFYGKPKAVLQDPWDRQLGRRDERVLQEWQDNQESKVHANLCLQVSCPGYKPHNCQARCCRLNSTVTRCEVQSSGRSRRTGAGCLSKCCSDRRHACVPAVC